MTRDRDDDLREAFGELRAEARASGRAPDFAAMMREAKRQAEAQPELEVVRGGARAVPARGRRRLVRLGGWASAAVAAALAALILVDRAPSGDERFEQLVASYSSQAGGAGWSSPTSGLLQVPGMELMRSVPSIGAPVRGIDPSSLPARQPDTEEENL